MPSASRKPSAAPPERHEQAFAEDHAQHRARLSAERRADADLACAPDHRVSHDPVDAHDGEDQRQTAKEGNHRGGCPDHPELHVGVEVLAEGFHREDRHAGRSGANLTAKEFK